MSNLRERLHASKREVSTNLAESLNSRVGPRDSSEVSNDNESNAGKAPKPDRSRRDASEGGPGCRLPSRQEREKGT